MDYVTFFTLFGEFSPIELLSLFLLTLFRLAPIVSLAPFLGAKIAPTIVRAGVALCLSVIFLPTLMIKMTHTIGFDYAFIGYALKELLIGFILGLFVAIPFYMVESSGILIDFLRGAAIMQAQDPTSQSQSSPIGILYHFILIVLFFQIEGPFHFLEAVLKSYEIMPPNAPFNPAFFSLNTPFWETAIGLLNNIMAIAIQLAAPSLVAILMAEMFLGIANRLAPQVQIAFLGMSLKSLLGLTLLWFAWFFIIKQMSKETFDWLHLIDTLIYKSKYFFS